MTKSRWLMIFLGVSVALNIFIAGAVLGGLNQAKKRFMHFRDAPRADLTLREIGRHLEGPERRAMRRLARDRMEGVKDLLAERRTLQKAIREGIAAPDLELETLRRQVADLRKIEIKLRSVPEDIMFEVLPRMDEDARMALSKDLFKRKKRRGKKKHMGSPPRDKDSSSPDDEGF